MAAKNKEEAIFNFIENIKYDVTGLIAVSVIDISSGMSLGSFSSDKTFNPDIASAYNAEVIKQKFKAIKALNLAQSIDDILITLDSHIHLLKVTKSQKHLLYLAADSAKVNLGMARAILKVNTAEIDAYL